MNKKHIILVDDEPKIRDLLDFLVSSLGYKVKSFIYPSKALDHYKENCKDILLLMTDLSMPGMTGVDLIKEVLTINPKEAIVVVTGFLKSHIECLVNLNGNVVIVEKPLTKSDLKTAIEKVIEEK